MAVRSCTPPVNTVPHSGQIVHSTSQHSTTWRSDRAFHQTTQYHMAVRSCTPPVNTVPHGGQIVHSTSQHTTTWRSDRALHQSTQYHIAVRSTAYEERGENYIRAPRGTLQSQMPNSLKFSLAFICSSFGKYNGHSSKRLWGHLIVTKSEFV